MSTLPHWVVVLSRFQKGGSRIDISFVQDGVNRHGKEVPEGGDDSTVAVQCGGVLTVGHACLGLFLHLLICARCLVIGGEIWIVMERRGKREGDDDGDWLFTCSTW